ncbi:MAG: DUF1566 domain-containing protein [Faecalibacterium sp.]
MKKISRRSFLTLTGTAIAAVSFVACSSDDTTDSTTATSTTTESDTADSSLPSAVCTLVATGQVDTYDDDGAIIDTTGTDYYGQDGDYAALAFSLSLNGDGTTTDNNTGLMWETVPTGGKVSWDGAVEYCESLSLAGYDDWRMPTLKELFSLSDFEIGWPYLDTDYFEFGESSVSAAGGDGSPQGGDSSSMSGSPQGGDSSSMSGSPQGGDSAEMGALELPEGDLPEGELGELPEGETGDLAAAGMVAGAAMSGSPQGGDSAEMGALPEGALPEGALPEGALPEGALPEGELDAAFSVPSEGEAGAMPEGEMGAMPEGEAAEGMMDAEAMSGGVSKDDGQFWSSNYYLVDEPSVESLGEVAFGVNHATGHIKAYPADSTPEMGKYVRAVRGNAYAVCDFANNGDGTITDASTGLMWSEVDLGVCVEWKDALVLAESADLAGYDDWRLPNVKELQSIVDYSGVYPAIDPDYFICTAYDDNVNYYYWTSTSAYFSADAPDYNSAWYVAFGYTSHGAGAVRFSPKYEGSDALAEGEDNILNCIRLVRNA